MQAADVRTPLSGGWESIVTKALNCSEWCEEAGAESFETFERAGDGKRPHLQGGRGTPKPIRLVRHASHGGWDDPAMAALALSKMKWNNDGLYDPLPVTISYAKVLARVLTRIPKLASATFQFRFFM